MIQKAKVLTLIVFGLLFINLSAQDGDFTNDPNAKLPDEDRKFRFGLQFSPNISWFKATRSGYSSKGSKMGFSYGLSFEYFMTKNYLFSTGLSILNTGGKLERNSYSLGTEDYKIKYIELPLLIKLRTNEIGYLTYYGQIGFKAGFNFSSNSSLEEAGNDKAGFDLSSITNGENVPSEINPINLALVIGVGVEYNISGNTALMLGVTFNNGFVDQLDGDASANLNYFALNIGIYF